MAFNELPPDTPWWRSLLANLFVLGVLGGLWAGHHYLTWRFSLGAIIGIVLMQVAHRLVYGSWIEWDETQGPPASRPDS
jgi:hypothetical protein